jgi:hypothetical protein
MSKCARCRRRKAKRACPARRDALCPGCCGEVREREASCPPDCRHLAAHKPYQERRFFARKLDVPAAAEPDGGDILADERLSWLALNAEAALHEIAGKDPGFDDGGAVLALEHARERYAKGRGLVILPGDERRAGNEAGEVVWDVVEKCRYEGGLLIATGRNAYTSEEKERVLARLLRTVKAFARDAPRGRRYLEAVSAQIDGLRRAGGPGPAASKG